MSGYPTGYVPPEEPASRMQTRSPAAGASAFSDRVEAPSPPARMTYEEFLEWADEDTLAEWVNGEVVMSSPAGKQHQDIAGFLESVLRQFTEENGLGQVLSAPFQMKMEHGREPDIIFIAKAHLDRLKPERLEGPADLVIEIVSDDSAGRDRGQKYYEYARGGVPEYWLIDPRSRWVEFYHLEGPHYRLVFDGTEGEYHARVLPGFRLQVEWLWQEPLPQVEDALLDIEGEERARRLLERLRSRGLLPDDRV